MIDINQTDFGTLCICAIRYCMGRKTYMPLTVQNIIREHLSDLSDNDINVMLQDREFQARMNMYGDSVDKADWLRFWEDLEKSRCSEKPDSSTAEDSPTIRKVSEKPINSEPQACESCNHYDAEHETIACERCLDGKYSRYEPKATPQQRSR